MRKSIRGVRQASTTEKSWSISLLSAFLVFTLFLVLQNFHGAMDCDMEGSNDTEAIQKAAAATVKRMSTKKNKKINEGS